MPAEVPQVGVEGGHAGPRLLVPVCICVSGRICVLKKRGRETNPHPARGNMLFFVFVVEFIIIENVIDDGFDGVTVGAIHGAVDD